MLHRRFIKTVRAIYQQIASRELEQQLIDDARGDLARRQHQPEDARRWKRVEQCIERIGTVEAGLVLQRVDGISVGIETNHMNIGATQLHRYVGPHFSQANEADLHIRSLSFESRKHRLRPQSPPRKSSAARQRPDPSGTNSSPNPSPCRCRRHRPGRARPIRAR